MDRNDVETKDPPDLVLSQKPGGGEKLKKKGTVQLRVSKATFTMPTLAGKQSAEAVNDLIGVGLQDPNNGIENQEVDSDQPPGTVVGSNPAAGAQVPKVGQKVTLQIAARRRSRCRTSWARSRRPRSSSSSRPGSRCRYRVNRATPCRSRARITRSRTDPGANAMVKRGSSVTMFVSTGPQMVSVPNVVGQMQNQASQTLQQAGFQVFASPQNSNNPTDNGRVLAQNPAAGQQQPKGSGVTLTVGKFPPGP